MVRMLVKRTSAMFFHYGELEGIMNINTNNVGIKCKFRIATIWKQIKKIV